MSNGLLILKNTKCVLKNQTIENNQEKTLKNIKRYVSLLYTQIKVLFSLQFVEVNLVRDKTLKEIFVEETF